MKKLLIIGSKGNMGSRYSDMARNMGVEVLGVDIGDSYGTVHPDLIIIATPTSSHFDMCLEVQRLWPKVPYLCEKPIATVNVCRLQELTGYMVNNWAFSTGKYIEPHSVEVDYDCSNTGNDGKQWDCIQLFHICKGIPKIATKSSEFLCTIDRMFITRDMIWESYKLMLQHFIKGREDRLWTIKSTIPTHQLIKFILGGVATHAHSHPSPLNVYTSARKDLP
jgi:hypothetical protein